MAQNLKIYYLCEEYINYLRRYDLKVAYNKNSTRPYVGVVYAFNNFNYFAPLASPKPKHLKISSKAIDVFKIDEGKLGIININNMIPTPLECINEVLPTVSDKKYKALIQKQTTYINDHKKSLFRKVKCFMIQYDKGYMPEKVKERCCNFRLLEEKCLEYFEN